MAKELNNVILHVKNGTKANWESKNPVLAKGEPGLEVDTYHVKYGDGVKNWNSLPYSGVIVENSSTNGNILIDGREYTVYTLPKADSGTLGGVKSSTGTNHVTVSGSGTMTVEHVSKADRLNTARDISIGGDMRGSTSFDGSKNVSMSVSLNSTGVSAGTYTKVTVDSKGRVTSGDVLMESDIPYIDKGKVKGLGTAAAKNTGTGAGNIPVLNGNGKLPDGVIPPLAISETHVVANEKEMLNLTAQTGDLAVRQDGTGTWILKGTNAARKSDWVELKTPTESVTSVNGKKGNVTLTTSDISEGSNRYYTDSRATSNFNSNFPKKTVGQLADGSKVVMTSDTLIINCGEV